MSLTYTEIIHVMEIIYAFYSQYDHQMEEHQVIIVKNMIKIQLKSLVFDTIELTKLLEFTYNYY